MSIKKQVTDLLHLLQHNIMCYKLITVYCTRKTKVRLYALFKSDVYFLAMFVSEFP